MKVTEDQLAFLLLGFGNCLRKKWRHHATFGRGIAPRTSRYRCFKRKLGACGAFLSSFELERRARTLKPSPLRRRTCWVRPIFKDHDLFGAWLTLIPSLRMDEVMFFNFFRMTVSTFDNLLKKVGPFISKSNWRAICPGERLAITLRYLASGDSQVSLSYLLRVSKQCISTIILETCTYIWYILKDEVMPTTKPSEEGWLKLAVEFEVMWNLPHCVGAIDGKHVRVKAFPHSGSRNYNYKSFHSLILMAFADAKYKFTFLEFGASGRRGDGNVFLLSAPGQKLLRNLLSLPPPIPSLTSAGMTDVLPFFFVGDAAFSGNPNIIAPIKESFLPPEENLFNYRISRARRVIENAFGILSARFRILCRAIDCSRAVVKSIVMACIALHNYHLMDEDSIPEKKRKYCPKAFADASGEDGSHIFGRWRNENPPEEEATFVNLADGVWCIAEKSVSHDLTFK